MQEKLTVANYRDDKYYPKVVAAVARILEGKSYIAPVDLFVEMGLLDEEDLKRWKRGEGSQLERVIKCNLSKAGRVLRLLRFHAHDLNLGPSMTVYKHGKKLLRFSRSGARPLEEAYSRSFVVLGKR